jgi:mono/diheme cytochrome c family protein
LGGSIAERDLAGGMIPMANWYASPLIPDAGAGLDDWEVADIAELLQTGVSRQGAVFGPMAEVVSGSLQHLSRTDIDAMASYLKSIPGTEPAVKQAPVLRSPEVDAMLARGAKLYKQHCAECHRADGKGIPRAYPPLAGARSLVAPSAVNPIRMVLNGGYPPSTEGNPRPYGMPPFGTALNDSDVADVVSYIRMSWGNKGGPVSPIEVGRFRGAPLVD